MFVYLCIDFILLLLAVDDDRDVQSIFPLSFVFRINCVQRFNYSRVNYADNANLVK